MSKRVGVDLAVPERMAKRTSELLDRIVERGIPDRRRAGKALRATLTVLGQRLFDDEARALASSLPTELARVVEASEHDELDGDFGDAEFYERVRRRERSSSGAVHEDVDVVVRMLGELLDDDVRHRLARALPPRIGLRLLPADAEEPPRHDAPRAHAPPVDTLASGRPGSRHPLSEARPRAEQSHSVAVEANPHGETKLSSARGLTQERHRDALSTGRPPSPERPMSEARSATSRGR
jgi:uncharacterized protein (DUF2267 family)